MKTIIHIKSSILIAASMSCLTLNALAADPVFSGPQVGERTTPFKVLELTGPNEGKERDPIADSSGSPVALVFVHTIERSLVPLLKAIDQYGAERKDRLRTEVVFLFRDRLEGEQRIKAAARSIQLKSRVGLSVDGAEGPGNYGLNKDCLMTIIAAKDNKVTANFALVQPGIADAPKVIDALAKTCGDTSPPSIEQLTARVGPRGEARAAGRMEPGAMRGDRSQPARVDLSKLDLNSEAGLREAVRALIAEVQSLRSEVAQIRGPAPAAAGRAEAAAPKEEFPGAVPTDPKLNGLLRQFIRPTNDNATVDQIMKDTQEYLKENPALTKQAADGWTRILHFGDRYGTAYAREVGKDFLQKLQRAERQR